MTWLRPCYLATPVFVLFDLLWGLNVRAVALDPFTPRFLVNFALSAAVGTIAFYETLPDRRASP